MKELKCPFQGPIITEDFGCAKARLVTVRNTPLVHCTGIDAQARCERVHGRLKAVGLAAFGMEDDLLSTPHSVMQRIQYGGLLGLQALLRPGGKVAEPIADVDALMDDLDRSAGLDNLVYDRLGAAMTGFELKRRRGSRGMTR
jgi:hypothetical protein